MSSPERFVVLVSSSQQEARYWGNLLPGLQNYPKFSGIYNVHHLPIYSMLPVRDGRSFLHHLLQQHQRRAETLAKELQKPPFWDSRPEHNPGLILVGLGPGCHLIQEFLLRCLNKDDDVRQIQRVHQAMFLTPPRSNWIAWIFGIIFVLALLGILPYFLWPNQALLVGVASAILGLFTIATAGLAIATSPLALTMLGMESEWFLGTRVRKEFEEHIMRGSKRKLGTWPVPSQELWPSKVRHTDQKSMQKVIQEISEAILEPNGHPNIYEADLFEYTLTVKPIKPKDLPQGARNKLVVNGMYTSQATYVSHVHFASNDQTGNEETRKTHGELPPWELRQRTRGYLEVQNPASANLATSEENFAKNSGYIYRFRPNPHEDYFLHVIVYGGYDASNQSNHIHVRADTNFRLIRGNLDLSGYLSRGWKISEPKVLFFHSQTPSTHFSNQPGSRERNLKDLECDCLSTKRVLGLEVRVEHISPGVFRWEKSNVRNGGIIAFEFSTSPR